MKYKFSIIILLLSTLVIGVYYTYFSRISDNHTAKVVVSIPPLYMIAREIMQGVDTPHLLIEGTYSPHDFALKPSENAILNSAKVIFWIGKELEHGLYMPIKQAAKKTEVISFMKNKKIKLLPLERDFCYHRKEHNLHNGCDHHSHTSYDPHLWLDPDNAITIAKVISLKLSEIDPKHRKTYQENTSRLIHNITTISRKLDQDLEPHRQEVFIVFHNAYQYFQKYFHLRPAQALTLNPDSPLKIKRLQEIKKQFTENNVKCLFMEPQFSEKFINTLIDKTSIKKGVLNPLGDRNLSYIALLEDLTKSITHCLKD